MTHARISTLFSEDTISTLVALVPLVNSELGGEDVLADVNSLRAFLDKHDWTGRRDGDESELNALRAIRQRIRALWDLIDHEDSLVSEVNSLLVSTQANPWLTRHIEAPYWHLHFNRTDDPLADRIGAGAAMAFAELIRSQQISRLKRCVAPECSAVLVDLSRNHSRMFCDIGNCGNRIHVAAYRARKKS